MFCLLLLSFVLVLLTVAIAAAVGPSIGTILQPAVLIPANQQQQQQLLELRQQLLLPLCVGNLLDRRAYDGIGGGDVLSRRRLLPPKNRDGPEITQEQQHCRLMSYTAQPIATCLDALFHQQQQQDQAANSSSSPSSSSTALPVPGDLLYSFLWATREFAILLSMAAWHMLREHGADITLYQRRMTQLGPILASMSDHCGRIIWLRQYTSVNSYGDNGKSNTLVVADKLRHYNRIALRRLVLIQTDEADSGGGSGGSNSRQRGVYLWDSSDPLADEYVRSCAILKRYEHSSDNTKEYATAYANCNDYVHTGYSALSQATQLLFNDLCNAALQQQS